MEQNDTDSDVQSSDLKSAESFKAASSIHEAEEDDQTDSEDIEQNECYEDFISSEALLSSERSNRQEFVLDQTQDDISEMPDYLENNDQEIESVEVNAIVHLEQNPEHPLSPSQQTPNQVQTNDPSFMSTEMPYPEVVSTTEPIHIEHISVHRIYDYDNRIVFFQCKYRLSPVFQNQENNDRSEGEAFMGWFTLQQIFESEEEMNQVHLKFYCME